MEKEFVSYEQAVALKELGFNEKCFAIWFEIDNKLIIVTPDQNEDCYYDFNGTDLDINAPLKQQVFRWFREKHNIVAPIYSNASGYLYEWHDALGGTQRGWSEFEGPNNGGVWDTYEEAENACIDKLIELSKQLNKQ